MNVQEKAKPWHQSDFVISDKNLAQALAQEGHADGFRYSGRRKAWRYWDGTRWCDDPQALELRSVVRKFLDLLEEDGPARSVRDRKCLGSHATVTAIVQELCAMRRIDEALFDPPRRGLLNCPGGTIDLNGAEPVMREHRRDDYITKITTCDPGGPCPRWLELMRFVTCSDDQLAGYLQRLAGYALIDHADEDIFAHLYGDGANGKSTFLQTLLFMLGDYGVEVPSSVFTEQKYEKHPEELMRMRGARLIVSSEIADNARWNVVRIKAMTGGDRIVGRWMNENSVEFYVCGTLIFAANNKPELSSTDHAMARRMHAVPFEAELADENENKKLKEELKKEAGGILQWCLDGYVEYRLEGLRKPEKVETATREYLADENHVQQWLDECCNAHPKGSVKTETKDLYPSWRAWCERNGQPPGSTISLGRRIGKLRPKYSKWRENNARGFSGIAVTDREREKLQPQAGQESATDQNGAEKPVSVVTTRH